MKTFSPDVKEKLVTQAEQFESIYQNIPANVFRPDYHSDGRNIYAGGDYVGYLSFLRDDKHLIINNHGKYFNDLSIPPWLSFYGIIIGWFYSYLKNTTDYASWPKMFFSSIPTNTEHEELVKKTLPILGNFYLNKARDENHPSDMKGVYDYILNKWSENEHVLEYAFIDYTGCEDLYIEDDEIEAVRQKTKECSKHLVDVLNTEFK